MHDVQHYRVDMLRLIFVIKTGHSWEVGDLLGSALLGLNVVCLFSETTQIYILSKDSC